MPSDESVAVDFSPAPWRVEFENCDCGGGYPCAHEPWPWAIHGPVHRDGKPYDVSEVGDLRDTDARLMAAAPTLYALVERAVALDPFNAISAEFAIVKREVAGDPHVPAGYDEKAARYLDCDLCGRPWPCSETTWPVRRDTPRTARRDGS